MFGFDIMSLLGLVAKAPTIIHSGMTLIEELNSGYQKAKATPGADLLTYVDDMMQALLQNKGAVATAILGVEPVVTAAGAELPKAPTAATVPAVAAPAKK